MPGALSRWFFLGLGRGPASFGWGAAPLIVPGSGSPTDGESSQVANSGFEFTQGALLPRWIRDEQGIAFEASFGRTKDTALALYKEATKARWPDPKRPDALPYQG